MRVSERQSETQAAAAGIGRGAADYRSPAAGVLAPGMQVKTLLNFVEKHKGFVYESISWGSYEGKHCLEVQVRARHGSKAVCSGCGKRHSGYDSLPQRKFSFVPLWGIAVFLSQEAGLRVAKVSLSNRFGAATTVRLTRSVTHFLGEIVKEHGRSPTPLRSVYV